MGFREDGEWISEKRQVRRSGLKKVTEQTSYRTLLEVIIGGDGDNEYSKSLVREVFVGGGCRLQAQLHTHLRKCSGQLRCSLAARELSTVSVDAVLPFLITGWAGGGAA